MMSRKMTAVGVANARCRRVGGAPIRTEIPDGGCPGLFLVLQPSGKRSWAVRYRIKGRSRKLTLDGDTELTLAAARVAATQAMRQVTLGNDPALAKQAAKQRTVEQMAMRAEDSVARLAAEFLTSTAGSNSVRIPSHSTPAFFAAPCCRPGIAAPCMTSGSATSWRCSISLLTSHTWRTAHSACCTNFFHGWSGSVTSSPSIRAPALKCRRRRGTRPLSQ